MPTTLAPAKLAALRAGTVIPAHPLALTADRELDVPRQRALTRYYRDSGAGGVAVAVHTTQFAIREPSVGLLEPVLRNAIEALGEPDESFVAVAGVSGPVAQAVAEAELAAELGYDAVLLAPIDPSAPDEAALIERARAVGRVLPLIGFYLQPAVGGRRLSETYWRAFADIEEVVAVKLAPFNRYRTIEALRGIAASERRSEIALYTGNDDSILTDLLTDFPAGPDGGPALRMVGGLLGQWAVWTRTAVGLLDRVKAARAGDDAELRSLVAQTNAVTDANSAVFDAANDFAGCIAGVNEVLRRQGLLAGAWCLDPDETLSPGQAEELDRVAAAYPWLLDDDFVAAHIEEWMTE